MVSLPEQKEEIFTDRFDCRFLLAPDVVEGMGRGGLGHDEGDEGDEELFLERYSDMLLCRHLYDDEDATVDRLLEIEARRAPQKEQQPSLLPPPPSPPPPPPLDPDEPGPPPPPPEPIVNVPVHLFRPESIEAHNRIVKTARFVVGRPDQREAELAIRKSAKNVEFLDPQDPLHPYYRFAVKMAAQGLEPQFTDRKRKREEEET